MSVMSNSLNVPPYEYPCVCGVTFVSPGALYAHISNPPNDGGYTHTPGLPPPSTELDPWKHRSEGMKCSSCMWFLAKKGSATFGDRGLIGRCRRHSPSMAGYPIVFQTDWCGDHKLTEEERS